MDGFGWTEKVEPDYWNPEDNPLQLGDCIIDKLDASSTNWIIEKLGQTMGGTKTITVSNGEDTKILNRELFEKDLVKGRYSFCDDVLQESDGFDWANNWVEDTPTLRQEYYFDYEMGDDPILIRVVGITNPSGKGTGYVRFKVLDDDFIQHHTEMFYDEDYGWDPFDSLGIEGFMEKATKVDLNEDFDWVGDVETFDINKCDWVIKVVSEEEYREVEQFLFSHGWSWYGESVGDTLDWEPKFNHFFADVCENQEFDSSDFKFVQNNFPNYRVQEWSNIRGLV